MNKIISFVLLCALLITCFSGCKIDTNGTMVLQSQDALVCSLIEYLQDLFVDHDMPDTSTAIKIDEIKNGKQALHVAFNKSECYFVCAYYNYGHKDEAKDYCCVTYYTWVRFNDVNKISEKYDDLNFIAGFQINKASSVTDIITKDAKAPSMEHFQEYKPNFNNGLNAGGAIPFDISFIYLNSTDDKVIYYSTSAYYNSLKTMRCVFLNERYYVAIENYIIRPDGTRSGNNLISDFGAYYDALTRVMDTDSYHVTTERGSTIFYGLIEIGDFAKCITE